MVVQQLQNIAEEERMTNRIAIKAFFRCAHFLAHLHIFIIPYTINFEKLVELSYHAVARDLQNFLGSELDKVQYTHHM